TLTLAGRGWRVMSVDGNRQRVRVDPRVTGGSVLLSGLPQPLSQALIGAIRRILQGTDADGVALTRRATEKLAAMRKEYAPFVGESAADVLTPRERESVQWWTWAGHRENAGSLAALSRVAPSSSVRP